MAAKKELGKDYPDFPSTIDNGARTPLPLGTRTTRTTLRNLKSRCAARCTTSSSRRTSGTASPTWPAPRATNCSRPCRRASSTLRTESFQSTFLGLFSEINLYSEKLGKNSSRQKQEALLHHRRDRQRAGGVLHRHRYAGRCLRIPDRPVCRRFRQEGGRVLHAAADFRHPLRHRDARRPGTRTPARKIAWPACLTSPAAPVRCCSTCASAWGRTASARSTGRKRTSPPTTSPA